MEERILFGQLGILVDIFNNFSGDFQKIFISILENKDYDIILSDMKYYDKDKKNKKNNLLEELVIKEKDIPLIYYIGEYDKGRGVPAHAFGITDAPDQLIHLVCDALERIRI